MQKMSFVLLASYCYRYNLVMFYLLEIHLTWNILGISNKYGPCEEDAGDVPEVLRIEICFLVCGSDLDEVCRPYNGYLAFCFIVYLVSYEIDLKMVIPALFCEVCSHN
jgi:hypothetical protein